MASLLGMRLSREQLALFLQGNHLLIKQFENLQLDLNVSIPELIAAAQNTADQALGLTIAGDSRARAARELAARALSAVLALPVAATPDDLAAAAAELQRQIDALKAVPAPPTLEDIEAAAFHLLGPAEAGSSPAPEATPAIAEAPTVASADVMPAVGGESAPQGAAPVMVDQPLILGAPVSRTVAFATAYQASARCLAAQVTVIVECTTDTTVAGSSNQVVELVIGPTTAVASGTGTVADRFRMRSSITLGLAIGIGNVMARAMTARIPAGWYFAVRQVTGTGSTVVSAYDQSMN